jgi:diaminopimelate decarboxylase
VLQGTKGIEDSGGAWRPSAAAVDAARMLAATRRPEPVCAYLYDLDQLTSHACQVMACLPERCRLFYAVKANPERPILEALAEIVDGFEVGSAGEIDTVRSVAATAPLVFGGPGKTDAELAAAAHHGVHLVHVESAHELRRAEHVAGQLGVVLPVLLRVNVAGPLPVATLAMAGAPTQFGIDEAEVGEVAALARRCPHVELAGFHFHSLSNHLDAPAHARLVDSYLARAASWARKCGDDPPPGLVVNAGGGIGVNYADLDRSFDWETFTAELERLLSAGTSVGGTSLPHCTVLFECGRYLVAGCGTYVTQVLDIKTNHGTHFAIVRGGTHHFRLPASWQHSHPFSVLPIEDWPYSFCRPEVRNAPVSVAGQLCSPKDVLARNVVVERLRAGDLLLFHAAGAYGWAISHHDFLSHPHPEHLFLPARTPRVRAGS